MFLLLCVGGTIRAENKALFVAVPNTGFTGLPSMEKSLSVVAAAFGRYVDFERRNLRKVHEADATKVRIKAEIEGWLRDGVSERDLVVVYLAGHGYVSHELGGKAEYCFWCYSEHNLKTIAELLSREEIVALMKEIPTSKKLLIIDSCGSGGFLSDASESRRSLGASDIVRGLEGRAPNDLDFSVMVSTRDIYQDAWFSGGPVFTDYLVQVLKRRSWRLGVFDTEELSGELRRLMDADLRPGIRPQDALDFGPAFFKVVLKREALPPFVIY